MLFNFRNHNLWVRNLIPFGKRFSHGNSKVRVRFAPSPTGYLHLGGLRTALYNYLFAKANNGKFLLRIEDTDRTRIVEGAVEKIMLDLNWAGIEIDEGPVVGGFLGPYVQSKRIELYREEVKKLIENGSAYHCFCSERRLELLRREAIRTRQVPKYDNKCRHLTPVQIAEKIAGHKHFCIRFKLTSYDLPIKDLVYGNVVHNVSDNEGDPVIMKSDGFPTYHFANVVDDHYMNITHVFRGVEWQISTTKHLLLYKAFQWDPPQYGHLPLLVNQDGTKLSKRQGDVQISRYKDQGIYPQALLNYVIQAGGGFEKQQSIKPKIYSVSELASMFDISKVNGNPGRLNPDLLKEFNRLDIIRQIEDPKLCNVLIKNVSDLVKKKYPNEKHNLDLNSEHIKNILHWASQRLHTLNDLIESKFAFLWVLPKVNNEFYLDDVILNELILTLELTDFSKLNLQTVLKNFAKDKNLAFSKFMKSLRTILSGLNEGPGVAEIMEILGKENTLSRIKRIKFT